MCKDLIFDYLNKTKLSSREPDVDTQLPWLPRQCMQPDEECPKGFFSGREKIDIEEISENGTILKKIWAVSMLLSTNFRFVTFLSNSFIDRKVMVNFLHTTHQVNVGVSQLVDLR